MGSRGSPSLSKSKQSHNTTCVPFSPAEERRKVRESILNNFKQRVDNNPEDSGALVVSETSQTMSPSQENETKKSKTDGSAKSAMENLVISDAEEKMENRVLDLSTRRKRRKTRAERNKLRENSKSKVKNELKQHITKANSMMLNRPDREKIACFLTNNRLTHRLGLFNQGKKSSTILRDGINLPARLKKVAEDDIRRIIGKPSMHEAEESLQENHSLFSSRRLSVPRSGLSLSVPTPVHEQENDLSSSPDVPAILEKLTINLNPSKFFPAKDLRVQVRAELCKLIQENCPPSAKGIETPMKYIPHLQISSAPVCRDLSVSLPPSLKREAPQSAQFFRDSPLSPNYQLPELFARRQWKPQLLTDVPHHIGLPQHVPSGPHNITDVPHHLTLPHRRHRIAYSLRRPGLWDQTLPDLQPRSQNFMYDCVDPRTRHPVAEAQPILAQGKPEETFLTSHSCPYRRIEHTATSANQRESYILKRGPPLLDSSYIIQGRDKGFSVEHAFDLSKPLHVQQKPEAVVTQPMYPHHDPVNLLYNRHSLSPRRRADLLDEMDMTENQQSQLRSPDLGGNEDMFWFTAKPPPFLQETTPEKKFFPHRLYQL